MSPSTGHALYCGHGRCLNMCVVASQPAIQHSVPSPSFPAWPADAQYRGKEQVSPLHNTLPGFNTHIKRWHRDRFSRCCEPDVLPCGTVVELLLMCHRDSIFRVNDRLITSMCACVCVRYSIFNRFVVRVLRDAWTLAQPVKSMLENFSGTGRWEGQVHLGGAFKISCFLFIVAPKCCRMKITILWPVTPTEQKHILLRMPYCFSAASELITRPVWAAFCQHLESLDVIADHRAALWLSDHYYCMS